LANHTNQHARPLAQQVLTENVCMTSNVLRAGLEVGVRRFVFASSIQAILGADQRVGDKPVRIPYLPLDDQVPSNPKNNYYALSKEIGERMLAMMAGENQELCCTALRFPFLISERWLNHWGRWRRRRQSLPIDEAFTHLLVSDAASLTRAVVEREKPGYHVYFPAQVLVLKDWSLEKVVSEFYPDVPLRVPASDMKSLVDLSSIERKLEWRPAHAPLTIEVD
jgi:nucleoside-diphosphate-sugar epimerase